MGDSVLGVKINGPGDVLAILDEINGALDVKKHHPSIYQNVPLVTHTVLPEESSRVEGIAPPQKGSNPYDSLAPVDVDAYEFQTLYSISLTPRTQHDGQGTRVQEATGTMTALLATPAEILLQTMFLTMPQWVKPFVKINDTRKCEAITHDKTEKTEAQTAATSVKKAKKAGKARELMRWVQMVAQVAQTFFAAIGEYVAKGLECAHDRGVALLARAAQSCRKVCDKLHETYVAASQDETDPVAWLKNGYKQFTTWLKALFN